MITSHNEVSFFIFDLKLFILKENIEEYQAFSVIDVHMI